MCVCVCVCVCVLYARPYTVSELRLLGSVAAVLVLEAICLSVCVQV